VDLSVHFPGLFMVMASFFATVSCHRRHRFSRTRAPPPPPLPPAQLKELPMDQR